MTAPLLLTRKAAAESLGVSAESLTRYVRSLPAA